MNDLNNKIKKQEISLELPNNSLIAVLVGHHSVNLTKLESYISGKNMKAARFYVDAEGHPHAKGMQNAIEEMKF